MNKQDDFDNVDWKDSSIIKRREEREINLFPKYKWLVRMEVRPLYFTVEADDAEEAMKLAEETFTLKKMNIDDVPELECTEATISNVTKDYGKKMNHKWNYKSLGDEE